MKQLLNSRVIYSVIFFALSSLLIILSKPPFIFAQDGSLRPFGVGPDKSVFPLGVVVVTLAILSFYIFCIIDLVFGAKNNIW